MSKKMRASDVAIAATMILGLGSVAMLYVIGVVHLGILIHTSAMGWWGVVALANVVTIAYGLIAVVSGFVFGALILDYMGKE